MELTILVFLVLLSIWGGGNGEKSKTKMPNEGHNALLGVDENYCRA